MPQLAVLRPAQPDDLPAIHSIYAHHVLNGLASFEEEPPSVQEMERRYLERVSLRRMVSPRDVAAMVLFLVSPLGRNISGQSLGVDGNVETL